MKPTGKQTMSSAMSDAHRYHRYSYDKIAPYLGYRVVEIGCGWGTYTKFIADSKREVLASDIDQDLIEHCKTEIHSDNVAFMQGDILDSRCQEEISRFKADSIVMMQVLEHIEDDAGLIRQYSGIVDTDSRLILSVPAFQSLYGPMDREAGHFRRYTSKSLKALFNDSQWTIEKCFYGNPVGGIGWWINNRLLSRWTKLESSHVNSQIVIFDKVVLPVSRFLELFTKTFFGQSLFLIAKRNK